MTHVMRIEALAARLRNADEDDVEKALAGSYVEDTLAGVERAALLEFYNRMLDTLLGNDDEFVAISRLND